LSTDELCLLFYHSLSNNGTNLKPLIEEFDIFQDLSSEDLIDESHYGLFQDNL